jgi:hypothetical protein
MKILSYLRLRVTLYKNRGALIKLEISKKVKLYEKMFYFILKER